MCNLLIFVFYLVFCYILRVGEYCTIDLRVYVTLHAAFEESTHSTN